MADELEIRVTVTRKNSTEASGADVQLAQVVSLANSADRVRFLQFMFATYGTDADGNPRDQQGMVEAFWEGIERGTAANIEGWEREVAAQSARNAVAAFSVTRG